MLTVLSFHKAPLAGYDGDPPFSDAAEVIFAAHKETGVQRFHIPKN